MRLVLASEANAARRRVYFDLRGSDGISPATGEAGGQPQVSIDGGAWTATGIGVLAAIGNGRYYADLTTDTISTAGRVIESRFKSATTAECPGDSVQVIGFDPALNTAVADATGRIKLMPAGLDDISITISGQPTTFPQWVMWLCRRFVRIRRVKTTGILSVYGSDGISVVTNQLTTDNATEQTTGAFQ